MGLIRPRRYSDAQREALLRAVILDELTVAEARRRAIAGELPGLPAFDVTYGGAREIVSRGRDAFELRALRDPDHAKEVLDADALQLVGFAHLATKAIEATVKAGKTPDAAAVRKAADAITSARRALGPAPRRPAPQQDTHPEPTEKPAHADVLDQLVAMASGATSAPATTNGHPA